jgi:hypothetical protein
MAAGKNREVAKGRTCIVRSSIANKEFKITSVSSCRRGQGTWPDDGTSKTRVVEKLMHYKRQRLSSARGFERNRDIRVKKFKNATLPRGNRLNHTEKGLRQQITFIIISIIGSEQGRRRVFKA